jgi:hypothetical protein
MKTSSLFANLIIEAPIIDLAKVAMGPEMTSTVLGSVDDHKTVHYASDALVLGQQSLAERHFEADVFAIP